MKNVQNSSLLFIFALLFSVAFSACNSSPPKNSKAAQIQRGKVVFNKYCLACHGEFGKGNGLSAEGLSEKPADLTQIIRRRKGKEFPIMEIAKYIDGRQFAASHGDREMPIWGEIFTQKDGTTEKQIQGKMAELVAYLMSIQE